MTDDSKGDAIRLARQYLKNHGLDILDESYTCRAGAIDLIYQEDDELVFATVNLSQGLVMPDERLTENDRVRMEIAAVSYLAGHDFPSCRVRFDTLMIAQIDEDKAMLCHHRDAFSTVRESSIDRSAEARRIMGTKSHQSTKTKKSKGRAR
jgi:putative endonuclease